jgi:hypothetical protein
MKSLVIVLVLAVFAVPLTAQGVKDSLDKAMQEKRQAEKSALVLRELAQTNYRAMMDIPANDGLFVEDGKLLVATYRVALKSGVAIKAGDVTKITQVKLLDFGVQIYFGETGSAIIGWADKFEPANQPVEVVAALAKKTVLAMFEPVR